MANKVGRPREFDERLTCRAPAGTAARIAALGKGQAEFIREAILAYLGMCESQTPEGSKRYLDAIKPREAK